MARRNKRNNAKTNEETLGTTTAPELRPEGEVEGMETNVSDDTKVEQVVVNENEGGEATNGTTREGDDTPVLNTDKIPQNGVKTIEVLQVTDNEVATKADEDRTEEEVQFADESNPNQKGRTASAGGSEFDQDGNLRTDGYSYGVAPDDTRGVTEDSFDQNKGKKSEEAEKFDGSPVFTSKVTQDERTNAADPNVEVAPEDVEKLEDELSDEKNGIRARVTSSTSGYYRIKFFRNNKPFVTYKSRGEKLDKAEVKSFVKDAVKRLGE